MLMIKNHVLLPVLAFNGVNNFIKKAENTYERMGVTVLGNFDGNFMWVKLPEGWHLVDVDCEYDILMDDKCEAKGKIIYESETRAIFKEVK